MSHASTAPTILQKIVATKAEHIKTLQAKYPLQTFKASLQPSTRSFYDALACAQTSFILECKKASPSKGLIRPTFDLSEICGVYKDYASAISVLTDEQFFQGNFEYLKQVRELVDQPLLCKDFFVDDYQIYLARHCGADAVLLMLSVLDDEQYTALRTTAESLGMGILTEVSNEEEMQRAVALNAPILGINNRNLHDLSTDLNTTEKLVALAPKDRVVISESGIYTHQQVKHLTQFAQGFLVGSSLMAQDDLRHACQRLIVGEHKVCGITRIEDAQAAKEAGASYCGLIFVEKSPRFVSVEQAQAISKAVPFHYVAVVQNHSLEQVLTIARQVALHAIQLHGDEDQAYIDALRAGLRTQQQSNVQIWKAKAIQDELPELSESVDRFVLDTKVGNASGGTGKAFDWQLLDGLTTDTPIMLAGGISPNNIGDTQQLPIIGVDMNSGVETAPGIKEASKIAQVIAAARNY